MCTLPLALRASPGEEALRSPPPPPKQNEVVAVATAPVEMEVEEDEGGEGDRVTKVFKKHKMEASILRAEQGDKSIGDDQPAFSEWPRAAKIAWSSSGCARSPSLFAGSKNGKANEGCNSHVGRSSVQAAKAALRKR